MDAVKEGINSNGLSCTPSDFDEDVLDRQIS